MEYRYQAKQRAHATCVPLAEDIRQQVMDPLTTQEAVDYTSTVELHDAAGNHLATGTVTWQVKAWSRVRASGDARYLQGMAARKEALKAATDKGGRPASPVLGEGVKNFLIDIDGTVTEDVPNEEPGRMATVLPFSMPWKC